MNFITRAFNEVFDFFCGDWRIFWGIAISIFLIELIGRCKALTFARKVAGIIFAIGVSLSLVIALKREIKA